jgi:hypothetical protein
MSHSILLAGDGTPASARAVDLLAGYRGESGRIEIAVVNVQARPISIWPDAAIDVGSVEDALLAAGREICEAATAPLKAAGLHADSAVRLGFPAEVVLREAQSRAASNGAMRGFALGSIAMRVAHGNVARAGGSSRLRRTRPLDHRRRPDRPTSARPRAPTMKCVGPGVASP